MQYEDDAMGAIIGASIPYRLAFGPKTGRKALTLQAVLVRTEQRKGDDLVSQFDAWIATFLIDQRAFRSAQMEGRQPVEMGVLFLKWKKGGYSS